MLLVNPKSKFLTDGTHRLTVAVLGSIFTAFQVIPKKKLELKLSWIIHELEKKKWGANELHVLFA